MEFLQCLDAVGDAAERVLGRQLDRALRFVPHHLAHAASAYYPSGFDAAAILILDGIGEAACSSLARGDGKRIQPIETFSYPHSLGFIWELVSFHLGFSPYDASKVMGLAAYGDPDIFSRQFASIIRVGEDDYAVDPAVLGLPSLAPKGLEALLGPARDTEIRDTFSAHEYRCGATGRHRRGRRRSPATFRALRKAQALMRCRRRRAQLRHQCADQAGERLFGYFHPVRAA